MKTNREEILKNVSITLYQTRWGQNLGQPDIAEDAGITQQQLSAYEKGIMLPSLLSLVALADVYDVSLDYLVGRCDNSKAHKTTRNLRYKED